MDKADSQRPTNPVTQITLQEALEDLEALKIGNKSKEFIAAFGKIDVKGKNEDSNNLKKTEEGEFIQKKKENEMIKMKEKLAPSKQQLEQLEEELSRFQQADPSQRSTLYEKAYHVWTYSLLELHNWFTFSLQKLEGMNDRVSSLKRKVEDSLKSVQYEKNNGPFTSEKIQD